jgi:hypothetical protein
MRPLDRLPSIKVKLGVVIVATVFGTVGVLALGHRAGLSLPVRAALAAAGALALVQLLARGMTSPLREMASAATAMANTPAALQLRLLQTIVEVAAEKNSTLVLPFPVELLRFLDQAATELTRHSSTPHAVPVQDAAEPTAAAPTSAEAPPAREAAPAANTRPLNRATTPPA